MRMTPFFVYMPPHYQNILPAFSTIFILLQMSRCSALPPPHIQHSGGEAHGLVVEKGRPQQHFSNPEMASTSGGGGGGLSIEISTHHNQLLQVALNPAAFNAHLPSWAAAAQPSLQKAEKKPAYSSTSSLYTGSAIQADPISAGTISTMSKEGEASIAGAGDDSSTSIATWDFKKTLLAPIVGTIGLGTPPQFFNVQFAAEWTDFWVVDADNCKQALCQQASPPFGSDYHRNRFVKTASSSYKEGDSKTAAAEFEALMYGKGSAGWDRFQLGDQGGQVVQEMQVGVLDKLYESNKTFKAILELMPIDGIFGIRPTRLPRSGGQSSGSSSTSSTAQESSQQFPLDQLLAGVGGERSYTIWMDEATDLYSTGWGRITFGGDDYTNCDTSSVTEIVGAAQLNGGTPRMRVGSTQREQSSNSGMVFFTPDLPALVLPQEVYNTVMQQLGNPPLTVPFFLPLVENCQVDSLPSLDFSWSNSSDGGEPIWYSIPARAYTVTNGSSNCYITILPMPLSSMWMLGAPFYRANCVKQDLNKGSVSLAKRRSRVVPNAATEAGNGDGTSSTLTGNGSAANGRLLGYTAMIVGTIVLAFFKLTLAGTIVVN